MRSAAPLFVSALALLLCACAGPRVQVHTLLAAETPRVEAQAERAFALGRVRVPASVDQRELVLRLDDGRLQRLDNRHWSASLPDEMRAALVRQLSLRLAAPEISAVATRAQLPVWRIAVDVQRFEVQPGRAVELDAVWSLRAPDGRVSTCQSRLLQQAGIEVEALVLAARQTLDALAVQIAVAIDAGACGR